MQQGNQLVSQNTTAYDSFYHKLPTSGAVLLGCGDDRNVTAANTEKLTHDLRVNLEHGLLRMYGGLMGEVRALGIAIAAQYTTEKLREYGATLDDLTKLAYQRFTGLAQKHFSEGKLAILPGNHSAESNEASSIEFNPHIHTSLGCAYCASLGVISDSAVHNPAIASLSQQEQGEIIGDQPELFAKTLAGAGSFNALYLGEKPAEYGITRQQIAAYGAPVMVLAGSHANPEDAAVVINLAEDEYSDPLVANTAGRPFYGIDAARIVHHIQDGFPELQLRQEILLSAILLDTTATRAALAGGDPGKLQLIVRGSLSN